MTTRTDASRPHVGLFVTCLVDLFRPNIGFATVKLLEAAGCRVDVPELQTCCGQPAYNSGDAEDACAIAKRVIKTFEGYDYVIVPSGSCTGMLKEHYPGLFDTDAHWSGRARLLADRCYELVSFLVDVLGFADIDARYRGTVTYHDTCSGLRELGIREQPRQLLARVRELSLRELDDSNVCCGFGGTFCVKYPEISGRMVSDKVANVKASGAQTLLGGDLGCLLNIAGRLRREGSAMKVYHVAEVLAGMTDVASIGGIRE
ncbi:MAG: (Fe-S)-binding protein [Gammaproteobacteria bacterium]|nr:(Fe-S)-binding protein [Gammaproteobacteria bacterium]NIR85818.1 (Fe-S)-binding protein [Gammaproteobacteria bacterium]NIR90572.1 (Fe-S)-binding protein [Gammaproteobacteria bacterium]NIU06953.1 (Fe-S)-binding protein [Gammaproteobacteria bacterium]NIV53883.1 (Fe-S)-binding protein [Gammaproteobacteria bacterium]